MSTLTLRLMLGIALLTKVLQGRIVNWGRPGGLLQVHEQAPTAAQVVQERLDLLDRGSFGTPCTNETMLDLHITPGLGAIPIDEHDFRDITQWIRQMQLNSESAKTIKNTHSLIFSSMETAAVNLK